MSCCSRLNFIYLDRAKSKIRFIVWIYLLWYSKQFSLSRDLWLRLKSVEVKFKKVLVSGEFTTNFCGYRQVSNIRRTVVGSRWKNCRSLRCSWSIACRRCSNYIFILDLTPGFMGLGKDNCKTRREAFKFVDLVRLILEILRYVISDDGVSEQ